VRLAYRTWNVGSDGALSAVAVTARWNGAEITATCAVGGSAGKKFHLPPNPRCTCGIHAWKRPVDPGRIEQWSRRPTREVAVGVVQLWGRMCDGEEMTGYRAQYARLVAVTPDAAGRLRPELYPSARTYRDPLTMYADWDLTRELGFAEDAATAAIRAAQVRRSVGRCLNCERRVRDGLIYDGPNPWVGGEPVAVAFCRPCTSSATAVRFDRAWAYAHRTARRLDGDLR
jgi:hypothetical protein